LAGRCAGHPPKNSHGTIRRKCNVTLKMLECAQRAPSSLEFMRTPSGRAGKSPGCLSKPGPDARLTPSPFPRRAGKDYRRSFQGRSVPAVSGPAIRHLRFPVRRVCGHSVGTDSAIRCLAFPWSILSLSNADSNMRRQQAPRCALPAPAKRGLNTQATLAAVSLFPLDLGRQGQPQQHLGDLQPHHPAHARPSRRPAARVLSQRGPGRRSTVGLSSGLRCGF
jgi:hypothetical protein